MLPRAKSCYSGKRGNMPDVSRFGRLCSGPQPSQAFGYPEPEVRKREQSRDGRRLAELRSPQDLLSRIDYGDDFI